MKILVVDDSATQRLIVKSIIQNFNSEFEIIEVADGTQALKILEEDEVKIVFSDINMEPMSGIELFEKTQSLGHRPIFTFVTSHLTDSIKKKSLDMGVKYFLTKPVSQEKVETILTEVIND